jgi:hypothetical protein
MDHVFRDELIAGLAGVFLRIGVLVLETVFKAVWRWAKARLKKPEEFRPDLSPDEPEDG